MRTSRWVALTTLTLLLGGLAVGAITLGVCASGPSVGGDTAAQGAGNVAAEQARPADPAPKVVLDETEYDLGFIDSSEACEHVFVIRNEGQAPLRLRRGSTTCRCTTGHLPPDPVPPGGQVRIRVASKLNSSAEQSASDDKTGIFAHGATIFTNDPDKPAFTLRIRGIVRTALRAHPPQILLPQLRRGESRSRAVVVVSQVWDAFTIARVQSSLDGLTWQITPADEASLGELGARSGYRLEVTTPTNLPEGRFRERLELSGAPADPTLSPRSLNLDVFGDVTGSMSVYGRKLQGGRLLRIGVVRPKQPVQEELILKIRDDHPDLTVKRIETRPDFLRVHVTPYGSAAEQMGLYKIAVEIPAGRPPASYMGANRGKVRIETDHPAVPLLEFDVEFAVVQP